MDFYIIEKNTFETEAVLASKSLPVTDLNAMLAAGYVPVRYDYPEYDPYAESVVAKIISAEHYDEDEGVYVQEFEVVAEPEMVMPTTAELAEQVRNLRDERITSCDWIISRHAEQVALGVDTTLTSDEYAAWLTYRQELRDLPSEDCFPWDGGGHDTPWPTEPQN